MKKVLFIVGIIFLSIVGCKPSLYIPKNEPDGKENVIPIEELKQGRSLYVHRCSGCHNLHLPNEYTAAEWKVNLDDMQHKAKINDDQKALILQFLLH